MLTFLFWESNNTSETYKLNKKILRDLRDGALFTFPYFYEKIM